MHTHPCIHNFKIMRTYNSFSAQTTTMHASKKKMVFSTKFIYTTVPRLAFNKMKSNLSLQPLHTLSHNHHYSHLLPWFHPLCTTTCLIVSSFKRVHRTHDNEHTCIAYWRIGKHIQPQQLCHMRHLTSRCKRKG
jgi:hypothetical protein